MSFCWENDFVHHADHYYSNGLTFEIISPGFKKNIINKLLVKNNKSRQAYGLGFYHKIYTPMHITHRFLQTNDRPYAGILYCRFFSVSMNNYKKFRVTSQLDLGILGPLSGADKFQTYIHDIINTTTPRGWNHQLSNQPYVNYNIKFEKGILTCCEYIVLNSSSRIRLGNIYDDVQLGISTQFGIMNSMYTNYLLSPKSPGYSNKGFQLYGFGSVHATSVFHNALLSGGLISSSVEHKLDYDSIKKFVYEITAGMVLSYRFIGTKYKFTHKTIEFNGGRRHQWSSLTLFWRF